MRKPALLLLASLVASPAFAQSFVNFESAQTRPIAISADGTRLFAVNTPDNRLEVYSLLIPERPVLIAEIPVGLEPVSVTPRTADEVWVVNQLGDSVSVVSLARREVVATIRVKDEPADVVFAGSPEVALVSVSGSDEVRVFDVQSRAQLAAIPIFGDQPRAFGKSADGATVWVAVHRSGNRSTVVPADQAPPPPPPTNQSLPPAPQQGIIVDAADAQWQSAHGINLPDYDVFEIDVATRAVTRRYAGVGTTLFGVAVHPATGDLWVANSDSRNLVRFEPNVRGHVVDHRLTRITPGAAPQIAIFDLNPGIDYQVLPNPAARATALAQPTDVAFRPDGGELYVAAFGTDRIAVVNGAGAVATFVELGAPGAQADPRNKRGPRGLAMHPTSPLLYVLNRLSMTIAVIDTAARAVLTEMPLGFDPTPPATAQARGFLHDAKLSGNGTASCASCHVDGDIDGLGWDLGDPNGSLQVVQNGLFSFTMHPMKGPMTTQTLRGLTVPPFHWRGDRATLQAFNPAFDSLLGGTPLPASDMDDFAAFMSSIALPPNPNQLLDRTYASTPAGTSAQEGFTFFTSTFFIPGLQCQTCHSLPSGSNGLIVPGALLQEPQDVKVPHLRNAYTRQGRKPVNGMSVSGFGLLHDGSINSEFDLLGLPVFQNLSTQTNNKLKLQAFVLAMDTGTAPTVGYSVTVDATNVNDPQVTADLVLLEQQALFTNCDLVAHGEFRGRHHGFVRVFPGNAFRSDSAALGSFDLPQLKAEIAAGNGALTFMGVPVGSGTRIGVDRDVDGVLDADEGLVSYGQPSPPCSVGMRLRGSTDPSAGNALFALVADGAPPSSSGAFLFNAVPASIPFLDVTFLVGLTGPILLPASSDASGLGIFPLPLPDDQALVGGTLFAQAIFPEPCGLLGLGLSDGLQITIGQ